MLFVPTVYQEVKGALLGTVVFVLLAAAMLRQHVIRLHLAVIFWTLLIATTGIVFSFYGLTLSAPGAVRQLSVFFLWPLLYCFLVGALTNLENMIALVRVMVGALVAICMYSIMYILYAIGVWPDSLYIELDQGQAIGIYEGFMEFNLYSISSLIFIVPFSVAAFLNTRARAFPVRRPWMLVAIMLGIGVSILSGRKALWLALFIAPFITWFFVKLSRFSRQKTRRRFVDAFAMVTIAALGWGSSVFFLESGSISLGATQILHEFLRGFDFSGTAGGGDSAMSRAEQFTSLMEGWLRSPIFGNGLGASASVVRSDEQPWAYELSYMALLFQTGVVGLAIYAVATAWIYWHGIKILKEDGPLAAIMLPSLVGMTCFLTANATNPYLAKFDYMWVIFWPLALINFHLLETNRLGSPYSGELKFTTTKSM
jgi:hypothetical protein